MEPVSEFLRDLQAAGRPATTQRSYSLALLRWFRFTWALNVPWDQATRSEARDFCRHLQVADKPGRSASRAPVQGKRPASAKYAPSTVAHGETVCRGFYSYHLEAGTGPIVNPFPLARPGRVNAHHNPMDPFPRQKAGLFRPRVPRRIPRQIPDSALVNNFRCAADLPRAQRGRPQGHGGWLHDHRKRKYRPKPPTCLLLAAACHPGHERPLAINTAFDLLMRIVRQDR